MKSRLYFFLRESKSGLFFFSCFGPYERSSRLDKK